MPRDAARRGLDGLLEGLPPTYSVIGFGETRLVIGPTGAFVVVVAGSDAAASAERARHLAEVTRASLASTLPWTPFVDALVVAEEAGAAMPGASVVPTRMLLDTLMSGPRLLPTEVVQRMAAALVADAAA